MPNHKDSTFITELSKDLANQYIGANNVPTTFDSSLPQIKDIKPLIICLRHLIFISGLCDKDFQTILEETETHLQETHALLCALLQRILTHYQEPDKIAIEKKANELSLAFLKTLPKIRELLTTDIEASFEGDPAAYDYNEIIIAYPGIFAISIFRVAHELFLLDIPLLPRMLTEYAHGRTGIDIHPGAQIGSFFFIDHGTGVVIGETTRIGKHVKIYQGVTLGALSTRGGQKLKGQQRHPIIGDYVTIYGGATILGGQTKIADGTIIGGNAFLSESIAAPAKVIVNHPKNIINIGHDTENAE